MPKIGTIFVLHIARVAEMADLQKQRGRVQRGGLLALAQHGGEIIDPRVGRRTLDGHGLHGVDGVRNAFVILELCEFLLRQRRRAAELEIGLAIDVRRLNVADAVGVAAVENDAVAGNLLVLLEVEHIADMQALGRHFDHVSAGQLLHQLVVRFLRWWGAQKQTASALARLMSSMSSRVAETAKIKMSGSQVVHGLFTEIALKPYALACCLCLANLENGNQKEVAVHGLTRESQNAYCILELLVDVLK